MCQFFHVQPGISISARLLAGSAARSRRFGL